MVSGYGGKFYHIVVWDINGSQVTARVIDSFGNLRDSIKYTTGVEQETEEQIRPQPLCLHYYRGIIGWNRTIDSGRLLIYDISGRCLVAMMVSGNRAAVDRPGRLANGIYLVRLEDLQGEVLATGRIALIH